MKNLVCFAGSQVRHVVLCALVTMGVAACDGGVATTTTAADTGSVTLPGTGSAPPDSQIPVFPQVPVVPVIAASVPTISGRSVTAINVGGAYMFAPSASDADGNTLTFGIENQPEWASFSTSTGVLTGTPAAANAGTYANIVVSVSDGTTTAALPAYTLTVNQISNGATTLNWIPPTENSDGTPLNNLAGYKVHYGTSRTDMTQTAEIGNPGIAAYTVSNLAPGTWYFGVSSYTTDGVESVMSGVVSAEI